MLLRRDGSDRPDGCRSGVWFRGRELAQWAATNNAGQQSNGSTEDRTRRRVTYLEGVEPHGGQVTFCGVIGAGFVAANRECGFRGATRLGARPGAGGISMSCRSLSGGVGSVDVPFWLKYC